VLQQYFALQNLSSGCLPFSL